MNLVHSADAGAKFGPSGLEVHMPAFAQWDNRPVPKPFLRRIGRLFITPYTPHPEVRTFLDRAQSQHNEMAQVTVAVLDAAESEKYFGVAVARRGVQPVYLRVENRSQSSLRLQLVSIDPNYYTPLEAAGVNHFSILKRLSAFGFIAYLLYPLLLLLPLKLITAYFANQRMSDFFREHGFRLGPIPPGESEEGFVFTPLDSGTKVVHICLHALSNLFANSTREFEASEAAAVDAQATAVSTTAQAPAVPATEHALHASIDFTFTIAVPGISADYLRRNFATLVPADTLVDCDLTGLVGHLTKMPPATNNAKDTRFGDPVNLVVVGDFESLISAFAARWDESESITLMTCWKTMRAFLLGSNYRYSPVSSLHLFGRNQDIALQRTRRSINERLHLRLWLTPLTLRGKSVWIGQVSRDIGVRFTTKAWNLTTHRIDPDVDEARDYVIEDTLQAERVEAAGYVDGVGACDAAKPRRNLTGDPYFTDGKRAVIILSSTRMEPRFVAWS